MTTSTNSVRRAAAALAGLTLVVGLGACSGLSGSASRSGGEPPPLVLTLGTDDPVGRPSGDQAEEFADRVATLSGGAIRIEPRYRAAGELDTQWDQAVARLVVAGDLDLGLVPARAWDTEGVSSLRALTAPRLVTTGDHLDAVVTDDELTRDLMAGLDDAGVTGVALFPEGIRYLMAPGDDTDVVERLAAGGAVRSPWSATTWAFFEALGAEPTDAVFDASMVAAESGMILAGTLSGADQKVVGNLPLFPKVNALVAHSATYDELTGEQQQWLQEAALATRDQAIASRPDEPRLAALFCEGGGVVVHDPAADSAAVTAAADEVTASLRSDEPTAALMDRIAALGPAVPAPPLPGCSASRPAVTTATIVKDPGRLPDGVYRVEFTDDYLRGEGMSRESIAHNRGVWTFTLEGGTWQVERVAPDVADSFEGVYEVRGGDLFWSFTDEQLVFEVPWALGRGGSLYFGPVADGPADGHFHWGLPWQRVGDVEVETPEPTAATIEPDGGDLPDGTYRFRLSDAYLVDHGLTPENAVFNHGVWTTVLADGRWTVDQVAPDVSDHVEGVYQVSGRDLWWRFHDAAELIHLRWSVTDDGDLVFEEVGEPEVPDFQFDLVWERVD